MHKLEQYIDKRFIQALLLNEEDKERKKTDINIKIKPNGDIIINAYNDTYEFDIFKAPEEIRKLNPNMFTLMQIDAIYHLKYLIPEPTNPLGEKKKEGENETL